jgi:hypothetical protein
MKPSKPLIIILAIIGNLLFVLWILYNGINEHFEGTIPEKFSYLSLMLLLLTNSYLLWSRHKG